MSSRPLVSIIIVVWNNYPDTAECLESLKKLHYSNFQTIVVDNGSTDGSGEKIKEKYENAIVLRNHENLGYTGGCNVGIDYACRKLKSDYYLILNNDTVISDNDFLEKLIMSAEENSKIGIVSPLVCDFSVPHSIQCAGVGVNLFIGRAQLKTQVATPPIWTDAVHGCAFLVKKDLHDIVGGLDDQFYLYWEETDYCLRVRQAGYKILVNSETQILHKSGKTIGGRGPLYTYYFFRNRLLLMKKHASRINWVVLTPLLPVYAVIHIFKSVREGNGYWEPVLAIYEGLRDFIVGNFGRKGG